jgi:hypothetical protein
MFNCKICSHEFTNEELKANHKIVIQDCAPIMTGFGRKKMLDSFDCPVCGCQNNISGERFPDLLDIENCVESYKELEEIKEEKSHTVIECSNCFGTYESKICDSFECDLKEKCKDYTKLSEKRCWRCKYNMCENDRCMTCQDYSGFVHVYR